MRRVKRVQSRKELERSVDEFVTRGYKLRSKEDECAILRDHDWGEPEAHVVIAGITIWWTFGLANVLYAIYRQVNADEIKIRVEINSGNDEDKKITRKSSNQNWYLAKSTEKENRSDQSFIGGRYVDETTMSQSDNRNLSTQLTRVGLQIFSLTVTVFVLFITIFAFIHPIENEMLGLTIGTLFTAILFRYTAVYHPFKSKLLRNSFIGLAFLAFSAIGGLTIHTFYTEIRPSNVLRAFQDLEFQLQLDTLLPEWWIIIIATVAWVLILLGSIISWDFRTYPKPSGMRGITASPSYFGFLCSLVGIWAVLFVGFSVQRIVVIAPIFEEFLKFGVALLISSVLFGRSTLSRLGTGIIVGSLFGFIEHATTYSSEPSIFFLLRTLFHMATAMLSISMYSAFEAHEETVVIPLAPVYPILIHFFNNTFVVLSSIIIAIGFGTTSRIPSLLYGSVAILFIIVLVVLSHTKYHMVKKIHQPFRHVLTHLV